MPEIVEMSERMNETIILHRWVFGGSAGTLGALRAAYSPGQEGHVYLVNKDAYTWDSDAADFALVGQWQGKGLEFDWDGAKLGIRREGDTAYMYTDLSSTIGLTSINAQLALKADKTDLDAPVEKVQELGDKSGAVGISAANGNVVTLTAAGTLTVNLTAEASSGYCRVLTLILTNGDNYTITWPASVKWADGTAPMLTTSGKDVITLITTDNGVTWLGMPSGGGFA